MPKPRTYYGVLIDRQSTHGAFGPRLPWTAYVNDRFYAADTLTGIKNIIRELTPSRRPRQC